MATLAELQTERSKLKAAEAKSAFELAHAATCGRDELFAATGAARAAVLDALDGLADMLVDAVRGEHDETRVHYLLSDAVHDFLSALGDRVEREAFALPVAGEAFKRGAKPRDLLTVSQHADRHRWLDSGTNAPGQWRTSLTPYLGEIMDSLSEHSPVRTVTFIKSSGVGGTEVIYNWLSYIMHHLGNKDVMVVLPTLELRDRSFNPRFTKMLAESPALAKFVTSSARDSANRADVMEYGPRAKIIKAGANSPNSLRSDHLAYVICDEVDGFVWDVGGEGDPMTLIENRQRTMSRAKTYYVSTPVLEGQSRIDRLYSRSDMRRYHVPCPHCGHQQPLEFGGKDEPHGLKWRTDLPDTETGETTRIPQVADAWYVCRECQQRIDETHKTAMLAAGRWIAERPWVKEHRGYHLNALYAPVGLGLNWKKVAQKWLTSQGDTSELKSFVNTYLGEVWRNQGDGVEASALLTRLEPYKREELVLGAVTAGVDVQKDRLEVSLAGWGKGEEAWLLDHVIIPGDTAQPEVWESLAVFLADEEVDFAAIDSGYNTSMAYAFCAGRRYTAAIKGIPGSGRPLVEDERKRRQRLRLKRKKGAPVEPLGVDQGKALIYARLKLPRPLEGNASAPGYIHFPATSAFDDEYFAQLAAERLEQKARGSRTFYEWVQIRARNEALDCLVYALAALRISGIDPEERITARLTKPEPKPAAARPAPKQTGNTGGSTWL